MRIAVFSLNYSPEITGTGPFSGQLAQYMAAQGHTVDAVSSYPYYPEWRRHDSHMGVGWTTQIEEGVRVYRCPTYIPSRISGLKRILHYLTFTAAAFLPALRIARHRDIDVVLNVAPTLLSALPALLLAKLNGAKSWLHIQDFEVEAGFATGQIDRASIAGKIALWLEMQLLTRFDRVSSISPEMCRRAEEKGVPSDRVLEMRNWSNIDHIMPQDSSSYRKEWKIRTPHVALYSGSIALKQGIETIIDTARCMADRDDITFIICGNGPTRRDLERLAEGLTNIQFHDLQPTERLSDLLSLATIHLLPQKRDAADLVLPSKLANMLASGRPVVAGVEPGRGLAREVEGAGLICEPEDGPYMAEAIERLINDQQLYRNCAEAARARAVQRWSKASILQRAEESMIQLDRNQSPLSGEPKC